MSLSREEIDARVAEHEALCSRQPQERDWRGNPVGQVAEQPAAPAESAVGGAVDDETSGGEPEVSFSDD